MPKMLRVWVSNQPDGLGGDVTSDYMRVAGLGDISHVEGSTWAEAYAAYVAARDAVAMIGHGEGCEDMDDPLLVASLPGADNIGAATQLQYAVSPNCNTWEDFVQRALITPQKLHDAEEE